MLTEVDPVPSANLEKKAVLLSHPELHLLQVLNSRGRKTTPAKKKKKKNFFSTLLKVFLGLVFIGIIIFAYLVFTNPDNPRCLMWSVQGSCPQLRLKLRVLDLR